jgi:hypothetical protein
MAPVTNRKSQTDSARDDYSDLARVRAEVVRALNEEPPNVTLLTAALERVDGLIDNARAELVAALEEFKTMRAVTGLPTAGRDLLSELMVLRGRDFFPWG